ncbi:MAG: YggS family pyridoxal phosphate-dependent enzyme [Bacilli bacterium]|nr:YggS family pyridoxal phosphate-dependent enzyme [Bacilli bacterium]
MDKKNVRKIIEETRGVNLVVASKYIDSSAILELYSLGIKDFGENRSDAFLKKYEELKDTDITWHFIGHLQTNKAKLVINKIDYLHSLDSLKLADIINKNRKDKLKCFVEVHMTDSLTKNGVNKSELTSFLNALKEYEKVEVIGLMTMTEEAQSDEEKYRVFCELKQLANANNLKELSMGMSEDYKLAIKAGATYIRLGRIICS